MNTTKEEREAIIKVFEQVPFEEDSFVWYILNTYIHCKNPDYPVLELSEIEEMKKVKLALRNLFHLVDPFEWDEV